ncbi:MAG: Carbamoylphosphate synthase large subunit short form [Candidatus Moranbacteria bacterium GW2011_GWA2_39_41]|nr:MAG: Carbamoylphosphate synthase large subunit short form [Candidatus Moranbacteria bacterium GW2011_GWA2_39_41]
MKNILVFPCGSEVGLEIKKSLEFSKDFKIYGASSVDDHGKFVYEDYIGGMPFVDDDKFIDSMEDVIKKYSIDFVFPAHDSAVLKLSQCQDKLSAIIVTSPLETCKICRSKVETYKVFRDIINTPITFGVMDNLKFPIFAKPDVGQGSKGISKISSVEELRFLIKKDKSLMLLEYLPGKEYTIDCFTDNKGELLFVQGRERVRVSNGISVNSKLADNSLFLEIAKKINSTLVFRGVWFFQVKENANKKLILLEIAPRVAGTMALSRIRGVNLPLLSLYDFMGINVSILMNSFEVEIDRALSEKYKTNIAYDNMYIDFDDTLIIDNKSVNLKAISLVYECINKNKSVFLITKHAEDVYKSLEWYKISTSIFTEIIHLKDGEQKFDFIKPNSIFVDDSFSERRSVLEKMEIPVFDLSGIDCL